jgi:hypothetical protein
VRTGTGSPRLLAGFCRFNAAATAACQRSTATSTDLDEAAPKEDQIMFNTISRRISTSLLAGLSVFTFALWVANGASAMTPPSNDGGDTAPGGSSGSGTPVWTYALTAIVAVAVTVAVLELLHHVASRRRLSATS